MWAQSIIDPTRFAIFGLFIGVLIAAPVGPVNIVCIQRTLERGFWGGFAAGLGAVLADGMIAMVAAYGATAISDVMRDHQLKIELAGSVILTIFGLKVFMARPKIVATATTNIARLRNCSWRTIPQFLRPTLRYRVWKLVPHLAIVPQTFFLTITNPGSILGVLALFGGATSVLGGISTWVQAITAVTSIMTGSLAWWAGPFPAYLPRPPQADRGPPEADQSGLRRCSCRVRLRAVRAIRLWARRPQDHRRASVAAVCHARLPFSRQIRRFSALPIEFDYNVAQMI